MTTTFRRANRLSGFVVLVVLATTGCAADGGGRAGSGPSGQSGVTELLPSGPNTFTHTQQAGSSRVEISGYVDLGDCSTQASGVVTSRSGASRFEIRNAGDGEAVSLDGERWFDVADPDAPLVPLYTPTHAVSFTVAQERGVACAVGLLDDFAVLSGGNTEEGYSLRWDRARMQRLLREAARSFGEELFRAYGATPSQLSRHAGTAEELFYSDFAELTRATSVTLRRDGDSVTVDFTTLGASGAQILNTFVFTPTPRRDVEAVTFRRFLDRVAEESAAGGRTFEQLLAERVAAASAR